MPPLRLRLPASLLSAGLRRPAAVRPAGWRTSPTGLTGPTPRAFSAAAQVTAGARAVTVASSEAAKRVDLPNFWLRDNCRCAHCVNQDTSQRNFDTFAIPADIRASDVRADESGLHVVWADGHESAYAWDFVRFYQRHDHRAPEPVETQYWGREIAARPPTVHYDAVMGTEAGVGALTDLIRRYGFAFVEGTPHADPADTQRLLERIAFIRVTHYGGFYDFVPDLAMADTAYTNLALPAHTDTTYFTEPAGLQAFHMLSHEAEEGAAAEEGGAGGASLLVDGFHAARLLRAEDPDAFAVLARVRLPWHASGNPGITIAPDRRYPVLELVDSGDREAIPDKAAADTAALRLHRVRWNNDDRGVVPFGGGDAAGVDPDRWYAAARAWAAILRRPDVEYWTQLQPGKPLIFDNWRVLHGRSAFVGRRRICGGYIARDDFVSRWRNTNYPREQVLRQVVG